MISTMEKEARSAPAIIAKQFSANKVMLEELCARLRWQPPAFAMTVARGSSDNAATFAKYLLETRLGWVTASAAPSAVTIYGSQLNLKNSLVIGLSQSGQSPDLAEMLMMARRNGALTVAIVNEVDSPLAEAAQYVIPLYAGAELAVAATKTYIATLSALVYLIALLTEDQTLLNAVEHLPNLLEEATRMDWLPAITEYKKSHNTYIVGRGYGFPIAQEAALKFKETAKIHAEAFSGAEVLHGPFALIQSNFPIFLFGQQDASLGGVIDFAKRSLKLGAKVMLAVPPLVNQDRFQDVASVVLPLPHALHPLCDPIIAIQAFYIMIEKLAKARNLDPDVPANLTKVTKTW